jgi:WD40 repeat protein
MCHRIYTGIKLWESFLMKRAWIVPSVVTTDRTVKRALFLIVTTVILSFYQTIPLKAQSIEDFILWEAEPLWTADSSVATVHSFAIHPNGNIIACNAGTCYELDGNTGKIIRPFVIIPTRPGLISISNNGEKVVLSGDGITTLVNYETGNVELSKNWGTAMFFPDNEKLLILGTGIRDSSLAMYNIITDELLHIYFRRIYDSYWISSIGISSDGRKFVTGAIDTKEETNTFEMWDTETLTKTLISKDDQQSGTPKEIHFSEGDKYLGFTREHGGIRGAKFYSLEPETFKATLIREYAGQDRIMSFCFIGEGNTVVTNYVSGNNRSTKIIDILTGKIFFNDIEFRARTIRYNKKYNTLIINGQYIPKILSLDLDRLLTTSVEEQEPNIFDLSYQENQLTIRLKENMPIINEISIIDMLGNVIYQSNNIMVREKIQIELPLPAGVYIAKLKIGNDNYTPKFVVAR